MREGRKHAVFINSANGKLSTVPRHTEIKRGLSIKICKDLQIPSPFYLCEVSPVVNP